MARAEGGVARGRIEHETRPSMAERHQFADPRERLGTRGDGLGIIAVRGDRRGDRPEIGLGLDPRGDGEIVRSEEHTSELQSLMRISYAVFCLKKKKKKQMNYISA